MLFYMALNIKPFYPREHPTRFAGAIAKHQDIHADAKNNIGFQQKNQHQRPTKKQKGLARKHSLASFLEKLRLL